MPTRPDPPEGDGKAARSYSLASAPLRLLSHSFHSTANSHNTSSHGAHLSEVQPMVDFEHKLSTPDSSLQHTLSSTSEQQQPVSLSKPADNADPLRHLQPSLTTSPHLEPESSSLQKPEFSSLQKPESSSLQKQAQLQQQQQQQQQQQPLPQSFVRRDVHGSSSTTTACTDDDAHWAQAQPSQKIVRVEEHISAKKATTIPLSMSTAATATIASTASATTPPLVSSAQTDVSVGVDGLQLLDRLLMPYDIRYSIFGHLSLHDIYHCQLVSPNHECHAWHKGGGERVCVAPECNVCDSGCEQLCWPPGFASRRDGVGLVFWKRASDTPGRSLRVHEH